MSNNVNQSSIDVSLANTLEASKQEILLNLHCHHIGTIKSFNEDEQTCKAELVYKKKYSKTTIKGESLSELVPYPIIIDCPVISLYGGRAGLTMPVKAGDNCLLMFNDRDLDRWFAGQVADGEVATSRKHSFADATALVGLRSLSNVISGYDTDNPVLFNEGTKITVKTDKVKIENMIESFMDIQKDFITELKAITTTNAVVGAPSLISPASQTALDLINTRFEGLLE